MLILFQDYSHGLLLLNFPTAVTCTNHQDRQ